MSDAALVVLQQPNSYTGNFAIDEHVLRMQGVVDFSGYRVSPLVREEDLTADFFLHADPYEGMRPLPVQILPLQKAKL
jgi:hypothetical protein